MDYTGKKVHHISFGTGEIIEHTGPYITVRFNGASTKKFLCPSCFESFLTFIDDKRTVSNKCDELEDQKAQKLNKAVSSISRDVESRAQRNGSVKIYSAAAKFFESFQSELRKEIHYQREHGGKKQRLTEGQRIERRGRDFLYLFEADSELNYPDGTQITIWSGMSSCSGSIISIEGFSVIIASEEDLGQIVMQIEFSSETWRLMSQLVERLEEMKNNCSALVKKLVCDGKKQIQWNQRVDHTSNRSANERAVIMANSQDITFIWGPPGTGKTQTLAKIVLEQMQRGKRILMLSYSNVSVDEGIERVVKLASDDQIKIIPGEVLRYGNPRSEKILEHEYLSSFQYALYKNAGLKEERTRLLKERSSISRSSPRYVRVNERLTQIRRAVLESEKASISNAKFVATTVTKAFVDQTIFNDSFDTVIFDEASMAYIPQVVFAASLAEKHFVCIGDFCQLPPIVQSGPDSQLNQDIFHYCGIVEAVSERRPHNWLCMLNIQRRMHEQIGAFISRQMYWKMLQTDTKHSKYEVIETITKSGPFAESPINMVDLSGMMSVCQKAEDGSHYNILSALLSFSYALEASQTGSVGIIAPYHAQARLFNAMVRDQNIPKNAKKTMKASTVHQFQGSEMDTIIYDAVDCYRMPYPGGLLTSTKQQLADRLFNVAMTRSKGKFVTVVNNQYMNKKLGKGMVYRKLIDQLKSEKAYKQGLELCLSDRSIGNMSFYAERQGWKVFLDEIERANSTVLIDIPSPMSEKIQVEAFTTAISKVKKKGKVKVVIRAEVKSKLPLLLKPFAIEHPYVTDPVTIIDGNVVWYGLPLSSAQFITSDGVLQTLYRPIIRIEGEKTAKAVFGYLKMADTTDKSQTAEKDEHGNLITDNFANYVLSTIRCGDCNHPVRLQKGRGKKFYLKCASPTCGAIDSLDLETVQAYLMRKKGVVPRCRQCKCSLEANKGPYGIYVRCLANKPHYIELDCL